jgi:nucleotide-binding universal stress UspA family protein
MYDSILVPTDGSAGAETAAEHAFSLAAAFDAEVTVLSVVDAGPVGDAVADRREALEQAAQESVEAVARNADDELPVRTAVKRGRPYETIREYIDHAGIDLVTMGTHGRTGLDRLLLGSVAERVVRTSPVPVLTARADDGDAEGAVAGVDSTYESVLVPTDGSEAATAAVEHALAVAERYDATVHVLSVVDMEALAGASSVGMSVPDVAQDLEAEHEAAAETIADRCERRGIEVEIRVEQGTPHRAIDRYVDERGIDLVTMGTHGRTGLDRLLLGSVTDRVIRTSSVPVLTVR